MPASITKNQVSPFTLEDMFHTAFPGEEMRSVNELNEGFFNAAYEIGMEGEKSVILKIAPPASTLLMTYEKDIMASEVDCMRKVRRMTDVPAAKILFYDDSHTICDADYFFMERLEGKSFSSCMDGMTEREKNAILYQMGKYTAAINQVTGTKFGYYGQPEKQGENWYAVFQSMIRDLYLDAEQKEVWIDITEDRLLTLLEREKEAFYPVTVPRLIHWDMWAGNVFVQDGKVTGIIDFERCLWGDELLEVGFRTYDIQNAFYEGYGMQHLSGSQRIRAEWYDIYLFLISCMEGAYRQYDNREAYYWGSHMLAEWVRRKEERGVIW
ncbi:MAG: aminoglycoside phosphotransferase family protein [Lachnospiraceae bacterium]|nr:aminoglycoside phosphotransferase family protein [Lachnospiraceae bacterium]